MKTIIPRFNAERMVLDYIRNYYSKAGQQHRIMTENNAELAKDLAAWKQKIADAWSSVTVQIISRPEEKISSDDTVDITVNVALGGLVAEDIKVVCLFGDVNESTQFLQESDYSLTFVEQHSENEALFSAKIESDMYGKKFYRVFAYPWHKGLSHPFEMGMMHYAIHN